MNKNLTFKISVFSGDIIYALAGIKQVCDRYNSKAEIYIWLNRPWRDSVDGQKHPYGVTEYALQIIRPLLESQPYIALCKSWEGEVVAVDLDELRTEKISTMPQGSIVQWPGQIWPDMICDASKPWIDIDSSMDENPFNYLVLADLNMRGKILINRTARWRNDMIHYYFLREMKDKLVFVGLPEEHQSFVKDWDLDIPHLKINNFYELAIAIRSCDLFIGNQSAPFALAEAMKVKRVLEICPYAPNVIPSGPDGYYFMHQSNFEFIIKDLIK